MTDSTRIATGDPSRGVRRKYDMRRLSYAGTFSNPVKANTIRTIEWLTAKITLLKLIRDFERSGAPVGAPGAGAEAGSGFIAGRRIMRDVSRMS